MEDTMKKSKTLEDNILLTATCGEAFCDFNQITDIEKRKRVIAKDIQDLNLHYSKNTDKVNELSTTIAAFPIENKNALLIMYAQYQGKTQNKICEDIFEMGLHEPEPEYFTSLQKN